MKCRADCTPTRHLFLCECGYTWDVYKVHREKRTIDWVKMNYPWIKLTYVAGGLTSKGQELDVLENAHIQSGSRTKCQEMQIQRIRELKDKNPDAPAVVNRTTPQLRVDALYILQAGMQRVRSLDVETHVAAFDKTGKSKAWTSEYQCKALLLHGQGKLFVGSRQEDTPYGQEMEPGDLEADALPLPVGAPEKPKPPKNNSARDLFVLDQRDAVKDINGYKTLALAEKDLKEEWKGMSKEDKNKWEQVKVLNKRKYHEEVKKWRETIQQLRAGGLLLQGSILCLELDTPHLPTPMAR